MVKMVMVWLTPNTPLTLQTQAPIHIQNIVIRRLLGSLDDEVHTRSHCKTIDHYIEVSLDGARPQAEALV